MGQDCRCTDEFYGDGVNCSADTDGDGLPDNPVLCDGTTPCVDKCPFQSRCYPNDIIIAENCELVCPEEKDNIFNITWPCTSGGAKRYVDCPEGDARASRICSPLGVWSNPNTTLCVSEKFSNITGNSTEKLDRLVTISKGATAVSGDVLVTLDIVKESSEELLDIATQRIVINQTANIISNLVRLENGAVLENTQIEQPVVQQIITTVNNLATRIGASGDIRLNNTPNVFIETKLLPTDDDIKEVILVADNIQIGEEGRNPSIAIAIDSRSKNKTSSFVVVKNIGNLLRNFSDYLKFGRAGININYFKNVSVVTPIITLNVTENGSPVEAINATMDIPIEYQPEKNTYYRPICVIVTDPNSDNPQLQQEVNDSTAGDSVRVVNCNAMRSASFLVLVGINDLAEQSIVLNIISYVGCSLSTICLTISISIYILFGYRLLKKIYHFVHFNLAVSLLITYLVFLLGLELPYVNVLEYIPCKAVSALMQYILLAMFLWMLMEGVVIFIMIYFPFRKFTKRFFAAFFCVCWISPLLYVLAISPWFHPYLISPPYFGSTESTNSTNSTNSSALTTNSTYSNPLPTNSTNSSALTTNNTVISVNPIPGFCWIHNDENTNLIFAVTTPILLIIIINILIFVSVAIRCFLLIRRQKSVHLLAKSQKLGIRLFRLSLVLFPVLGFGWTFGLIAIISHVAVFAWIFTILGSGQGILILFFVLLIRKDIRLSILRALNLKAKLSSLSSKITSQLTRQTTAAPFYWNLARMLENEMLTRSTLELAKRQGLISPIVEIDDLISYLEEKPWETKANTTALDEWDLQYLRDQLVPESEPEKAGLPPIFEITQLLTFLEERAEEEKCRRTILTDISVADSSIFVSEFNTAPHDTYSKDFIYQDNDPFPNSGNQTELEPAPDLPVDSQIDFPDFIQTKEEQHVEAETHSKFNVEDNLERESCIAVGVRSEQSQSITPPKEFNNFEIPELNELEKGLVEFEEAIANISDKPIVRSPKQVIELKPDKLPTLKSVKGHQQNKNELPLQILKRDAQAVANYTDENITSSLLHLVNSNLTTTELPQLEIFETTTLSEQDRADQIDTLDMLISQIDDVLTDFDTINPFSRI